MISVGYGDSFKSGSAPPTSVYVHHVDSSERERLLTTTPSTYTVELGTDLKRVATIQVGDVQLPASARFNVDNAHRHLGVSSPIVLDVATTLSFTERVQTVQLQTGATAAAITSYSLALPATVTALSDDEGDLVGGDANTGFEIQCTSASAVEHALSLWPPSVVPTARLVGVRTDNFDVVLTPTTVQSFTTLSLPYSFTLTPEYSSDISNNLASAVVSDPPQFANAATKVYVTPLTIPEWVAVLDAALAVLSESSHSRYKLSLNPETGLVELTTVSGDIQTRTTRTETIAQFTVVENDAMWHLGFPVGTWTLPVYKNPRLSFDGVRVDTTPFVMAVQPRAVCTVQLRRGRYCRGDDLAAELTRACTPLSFATAVNFKFSSPGGEMNTVVIPAGRYSATQLAAYMQFKMNDTGTCNVEVTAQNFGFVIEDMDARPFALDFAATTGDATPAVLAAALGFDAVYLSGSAVYASTHEAWGTTTRASLAWTSDALTSSLRCRNVPHPTALAFVSEGSTFNIFVFGNDELEFKPFYFVGDLVRVRSTTSGGNSVLALVARVSLCDETDLNGVNQIDFDFGALTLGDDEDSDLNVSALNVLPATRPAFCLHMAPPPRNVRFSAPDTTGAALLNPTLANPAAARGMSDAYGPLFEQLGFLPTTVQSSEAGQICAPGVFTLDPPPYVLLALLSPSIVSERAMFRPSRCDAPQPVLAKFIVTGGFARISEESTHVSLTSLLSLNRVQVAWLNPDGTLVDWNGANHSYSLLFRVVEGKVHGVAVD